MGGKRFLYFDGGSTRDEEVDSGGGWTEKVNASRIRKKKKRNGQGDNTLRTERTDPYLGMVDRDQRIRKTQRKRASLGECRFDS